MKITQSCSVKRAKIVFFLVLSILFLCYILQLTRCGLWYDESIEYFYSKYMGLLPDNMLVVSDASNMYERICSTFQPPLYNVLMYFWLLIFDGEASFRLAGVIVTFVGAIGFFKSIRVLTDCGWASAGIIVYLLTNSVMFYALECAEYNLMLCIESWAMFYFARFLKEQDIKRRKNSIVGFFIFAILAAYSQYGSILLMVPLCIAMIIDVIRSGDKKLAVVMIVGIAITLVFFALPLLYFFLIPQMEVQHSIGVSHTPVFIRNVFHSFLFGLYSVIQFLFAVPSSGPISFFVLFLGVIALMGLCNRSGILSVLWSTMIAVYVLYFVLVACSYYAYNDWNGQLGCHNLGGMNGRYTLYMLPLVLLVLIYGVFNFKEYLLASGKCGHNTIKYCLWGISLFYTIAGVRTLFLNSWQKQYQNDVRDVYELWESLGGSKNYTIVADVVNPPFQYYFMHSDEFNDETVKNVVGEGLWSSKATSGEIYLKQDSIGVYGHDVVYAVIQGSDVGEYDPLRNNDIAMRKAGYSPKYILDQRKEKKISLIMYSKSH